MLLCPHSKEIRVEKILGIFIYQHVETNEGCALMNVFDTKVDSILESIINTRSFEQSHTIKAILATSHQARKNLYTKLSQIDDEDQLSDILTIVVPLFWNMRQGSALMQEFIGMFGMPLVQNINILFQKDLSNRMVQRVKYLPMKHLTPKHIRGLMEKLEEQKEKKKQGIKDILYGK